MNLNEIVEDVDFFCTEEVEREPTVYDVCEEITRLRAIAATVGHSPEFWTAGDLEGRYEGCIRMAPFKIGETEYVMKEITLDYETIEYIGSKMGFEEPVKYVPTEPDEVIALGGYVVKQISYEEAVSDILAYLEQAKSQGDVMVSSVREETYEITMFGIRNAANEYIDCGKRDDYVSPADAQRLVDSGLARYW